MNSQYSQFVHQTKLSFEKIWIFHFKNYKIYIPIYRSKKKNKKLKSRSQKIVHTKFNFSLFIVKNSPAHEYIKRKILLVRKTHSLSTFSFVLPLDIHRGKEAFFHECSKSSMHSEVHKFNVQLVAQIRHSLIPLDVNASPYEKRKRKREQEKGRCSVVLELTPQILIRVSSPCYRFNTFKSDCTLRLHVQPLRPTATNQDQDGEKEGGWVSGVVARGKPVVIPSKSTVERRQSRI